MSLRAQCRILMAYSLVLVSVAWVTGFAVSADFNGYFTRLNWMFFAAYWVLVYALVWATWEAFLEVWRTLVDTEVIQSVSGKPVDDSTVDAVVQEFRSRRPVLIGVAVLLSAIANGLDISDWAGYYTIGAKWLKPYLVDFNLAFLVSPPVHSKVETGIFTAFVYLQQFLIGVLGLLALLQILFHTLMFGYFEGTLTARLHGLTLRLNRKSPINEFGLEYWNQALNNLYWLFSIGLLIPLLSRHSQPDPAVLNVGQKVLEILVAILLLTPMFLTIVVRQLRLPATWNELSNVAEKDSKQAYKDFQAQRLWPLDKNWASKLGIILAFLMLSYLIGAGFSDLAKKIAVL